MTADILLFRNLKADKSLLKITFLQNENFNFGKDWEQLRKKRLSCQGEKGGTWKA